MTRNRHAAVAAGVTVLLTIIVVTAFVAFADDATQPLDTAAITVAVLQIAIVMVVASLALSRARTRLYGWEAMATAAMLALFIAVLVTAGGGADISMLTRPAMGLVGILAFALFDTGRPATRVDRWVTVPAALMGAAVALAVGVIGSVTAGAWAALPCTDGCEPYGLDLLGAPGLTRGLQVAFTVLMAAASLGCITGLVTRYRNAPPWRRAVIAPVAWLGTAYAAIGLLLLAGVAGGLQAELPSVADPILIVRRLLPPLGIGAAIIIAVIVQRQAARMGLDWLGRARDPAAVERALQRIAGDPDLRLHANACAPRVPGRVVTEVRAADGHLLGTVERRRGRDDEAAGLEVMLPAAALALDGMAARERLAQATADERARMERDLHDGVQQHLVAMRMRLGLLEAQMQGNDRTVREGLEDLITQSEVALDELRALARGQYAGTLARTGLRPALEQVAARSGRDVRLAGVSGERLPTAIEEAIYFSCREALQNAMKHGSGDAPIIITARADGTDAVFEISDVGDARAPQAPATPPRTVAERVRELGGDVTAFSSAAGGRRVSGRIPLTMVPQGVGNEQ